MELEKEILDQYQTILKIDAKTRQDAVELFNQYKNKQHEIMNSESVHAIMRCAIFAAAKLQVYPTVSDSAPSFKGCGLSVTQFLRGSPQLSIDFFMKSLRHFLDYVRLPAEVQAELQMLVAHFAFMLTMFTKFEEVLKNLGIQGRPESIESFKTLGWYMFILARSTIIAQKNEIIECAILLIAVLEFMVLHCPIGIRFDKLSLGAASILNEEYNMGTLAESAEVRKEKAGMLRKMFCEIFKIKQAEVVLMMEEQLERFLLESEPIKSIEGKSCHNYFNTDRIPNNVKKLGNQYQAKLGAEDLDERIFVISEIRITTPLKFTPFARQGLANRAITPAKPEEDGSGGIKPVLLKAKRTLNYDLHAAAPKAGVSLGTKLNEIKFSQTIPTSPYTVSKLPCATPVTRAMEMNNWLQEHTQKVAIAENNFTHTMNKYLSECENGENIKVIIEEIFRKVGNAMELEKSGLPEAGKKKSIATKTRQIQGMYFRIAEELLAIEEKKGICLASTPTPTASKSIVKNPLFHKSVIAASVELVLFVHNSIALRFEHILDLCSLSAFDFWKLIRPFLKFDPMMPSPLKIHFQEIEIKIITSLAWQKNSPIHTLISQIIAREKLQEKKQAIRIENNYVAENAEAVAEGKATPMKDIVGNLPGNPQSAMKEDKREEVITGPPQPSSTSGTSPEREKENQQYLVYEGQKLGVTQELFFKRVLQVVASKIMAITEALGISEDIVKEKIWEAMKHCLSVETDLFMDRHIDQILLCTVYSICKIKYQNKYLFNGIIAHYIELHSQASELLTSLFFKVRMEEGKCDDIIGFYNKIYIVRMKGAICTICQPIKIITGISAASPKYGPSPLSSSVLGKTKIRALAPESPLRANLPPAQFSYPLTCSMIKPTTPASTMGNMKLRSPMPVLTPRTKALYAYGEVCPLSSTMMSHATRMPGATLVPSSSSEKKTIFKESLRSQILDQQQQKVIPPHSETGKGKPPKSGRVIPHLGKDTGISCSKSLFTKKVDNTGKTEEKKQETFTGIADPCTPTFIKKQQ